jgi:hypothetical protein
MSEGRWEQADLPDHPGLVVSRDKYQSGMVAILRDGEVVVSAVPELANSWSLDEAVIKAQDYLAALQSGATTTPEQPPVAATVYDQEDDIPWPTDDDAPPEEDWA